MPRTLWKRLPVSLPYTTPPFHSEERKVTAWRPVCPVSVHILMGELCMCWMHLLLSDNRELNVRRICSLCN